MRAHERDGGRGMGAEVGKIGHHYVNRIEATEIVPLFTEARPV